jgi:predicted TIM-barrel fold metal-dependent hydrolase
VDVEVWPAAERAGLPVALMAARFLPKKDEVAQRYPGLELILDHLGRPSGITPLPERWANLPEVLALARFPNVAMKAAGAPSYSDQPYPFRDIHDNLRRIYLQVDLVILTSKLVYIMMSPCAPR